MRCRWWESVVHHLPGGEADVCDVLVADDPSLCRQLPQRRLSGVGAADERHELGYRQEHRTVGITVTKQSVHLQERPIGMARLDHEAVVDHPFEHGGRSDAHADFITRAADLPRHRVAVMSIDPGSGGTLGRYDLSRLRR